MASPLKSPIKKKGSPIFTRITNETRDDNVELISKHRAHLEELDPIKRHVQPRYLSHLEHERVFINELESIIGGGSVHQNSVLSNATTLNPVSSKASLRSKGSSVLAESRRREFSSHVKEVSASWAKGPVKIGPVLLYCIFCNLKIINYHNYSNYFYFLYLAALKLYVVNKCLRFG